MVKNFCATSLAILLCVSPLASQAAQFPLWEAGAGVAVVNFPDYRGSDERQSYVLPFPYFIYRGDFLKVEDQRVRGQFFKNDNAEADISINGTVPVRSEDNRARNGMPDIDPTLEIGPSLNIFLHRSADKKYKLDLRLPLRAVIASDFSNVHHEGWVFQPNLNVDIRDVLGYPGWKFGFVAGPMFSSRRYNEYIYGVAPAYATADRPAYTAHGGYGGSQIISTLSKRYPNFWVGGFVKFDTLNGATFADSPLVKTNHNFAAGFAVSWIFSRSGTIIEEDN